MRAAFGTEVEEKLKPRMTPWEVVKRVAVGVYNDGFIHAGNLAYLSIVALFPFFIVAAAVAHLLGQGQDAMLTVPKGTSSGKVLRLKGRGFTAKDGKRGDQLVTVEIEVPANDTQLQQFAESWGGGGNPRASLGV